MNDIKRNLKITGDSKDAVKAIDAVTRAANNTDFSGMAQSANRAFSEIEQRAAQAAAKQRDLFKDNFGDVSSATSALGGALGAVGGGAGQGIAQLVSDITGAVEYLPALGQSVKDIGLKASQSTGLVGSLASGIGAIIPGLGAAGAGLAAVALPVAAIASVAALAAAAISLYNEQVENSKKAAEFAAEAIKTEVERRYEINDLIKAGNAEELKARSDAAEKQLAIVSDQIAETSRLRDEALARGDNTQADVFKTQLKELNEEFISASQASQQYWDALKDPRIADAVTEVRVNTNLVASGFEDLAVTTKDTAAEEAKLAAERDRANQTIASLVEQEKKLIASSEDRAKQLEASRALQDGRETQDRIIKSRQAAEDLNRALEEAAVEHQENILDIAADGAQKVFDLQQSIVQKQVEANEQISEANADYAENLTDLNTKYYDDAAKAARDFNRKRQEIEQDYQDTIAQAERDTDVRAFIDAQKEKQDALDDVNQDELDAATERQQQLEDERAKLAESHAERLTQIQDELAKFTDQTNQQIALEKSLTENAIANANAEYEAKLTKDAELRAIQEEREKQAYELRWQRLEEDRRLQDEAAAAQLAQQLADIQTKRDAELAALDAVLAKLGGLGTPSLTGTAPLAPTTTPGNGFAGPVLPAPTGNSSVNVNFSGANFGQIATPKDLNDLGKFISNSVNRAIQKSKGAA